MRNKISLSVIVCIFISIILVRFSNPNWGKNGDYGVLAWDNFGYYLYLPATVIYNDPDLDSLSWLHNIREKYNPSPSFYQAHALSNSNHVIQYSMGMAIIYSPAFFAAHCFALISDSFPADGFSEPYQLAVLLESMLLVMLGLIFIRLFALKFFSDGITALIIIWLCLGTNYFQITTVNTSTPHSILFAFYALLLYLTYLWHQEPRYWKTALIGALTGLMALSRPNEILFLLIPLLWNVYSLSSFRSKSYFFIKRYKHLLLLGILLLILGSLQFLYWRNVVWTWFYDSYAYEDFKLLNPYITEYLFSYKKGWLLYTPIMIFGILGFISMYRHNKKLFLPFFLFAFFNIWILSSWDNWWYADSFSQRSIVQSYPIFILPIGYLLKDIFGQKKILRIICIAILTLLVLFNLFQTYQARLGIIHTQRMSKAYYWEVFGDLERDPSKFHLLEVNRGVESLPESLPQNHYLIYNESFSNKHSPGTFNFQDSVYPNEGVLKLTKDNPFTKKISFAMDEISTTDYVYAVAKIRYRSDYDANENPFAIVMKVEDHQSHVAYKYRERNAAHIDWFEKGSWSSMELVFVPPYLRSRKDSLQMYIWLKGEMPVIIDHISLEIYDPGSKEMVAGKKYINNFNSLKIGNWSEVHNKISSKGYNLVNNKNPYSSTLILQKDELKKNRNEFLISCIGLSAKPNDRLFAVVSVEKDDEEIYYKSFPLIQMHSEWFNYRFNGTLPKQIANGSILKFYIWNPSETPFFINQLSFKLK